MAASITGVDPAAQLDKDTDFALPATPKFQVAPGYDNAFLNKKFQEVSIPDLIASQRDEYAFEDDWDKPIEVLPVHNQFLWCVLLSVDGPPAEKQNDFMYMKINRGKKTWTKTSSSVKRSFKFADLNDPKLGIFTLLEKSNNETNQHWRRDVEKRIKVGERFAILSPKYLGKLKSGSSLISTDRAIEKLIAPTLPSCLLLTNQAENTIKYFIIKDKKILPKPGSTAVVWKTKCNSTACDRLPFHDNQDATCGCFFVSSRNDMEARNTILKFDFMFRDDQTPPQTQIVDNFTSLRTSELFFENTTVNIEYKQASENGALDQIIIEKHISTLQHVNDNGGWTIIGWYMRAVKDDENRTEDDDYALHQRVKLNVCYLYPSKLQPSSLPTNCTITKNEVKGLQSACQTKPQPSTASYNL